MWIWFSESFPYLVKMVGLCSPHAPGKRKFLHPVVRYNKVSQNSYVAKMKFALISVDYSMHFGEAWSIVLFFNEAFSRMRSVSDCHHAERQTPKPATKMMSTYTPKRSMSPDTHFDFINTLIQIFMNASLMLILLTKIMKI